MEFNDLQQTRYEKLRQFQAAGIDPFPARVPERTHTVAALQAAFDELLASQATVTIMGRLRTRRIMGKSSFAHLADDSGSFQAFLSKRDVGDDAFDRFVDLVDLGDIVAVTGYAFTTKTGEPSVHVTSWTMLSKALTPPPDKREGQFSDSEARQRQRYIDLSANPEVRVNLFSIPDEQVKTQGGILFFYNPFIRVDPMGAGLATMSCPLPDDITIGNAQSHMHRRGVGYSATLLAPDASPELIYSNDAWEGVPVKEWEEGLAVVGGSRIEYGCDYQNGEDRQVYQGPKSTDEMCMFIASYWPANNQVSVCATDPDDTVGTQALNAEWVGNGAATCEETLGCIQGISSEDQQGFFQALTDCVLDSDPAESLYVSNGVRCLLTHADPVADCLPEIQACIDH